MNWDAFAGGVAKGYTAAEELRMKKDASKRDKTRFEDEQASKKAVGAIPIPGDEGTFDGQTNTYVPPVALPPEHQQVGLISRLAGAIGARGAKSAAQSAGVLPPPPPPVDPNDPNAQVPVPANIQATPAPGTTALPPDTMSAPETVVPGKRVPKLVTREVTDEDVARAQMVAARTSGDPKVFNDAVMNYHGVVTMNAMKAIAGASNDELGYLVEKALPKGSGAVEVEQGPDGQYTVTQNGKPWQTFGSRDAMLGTIQSLFDGDVTTAAKFTHELSRADAEAMRAKATVRQKDVELRHEAARLQNETTRTGVMNAKDLTELQSMRQAIQLSEKAGALDPVLDADEYDAVANQLYSLSPKTETQTLRDADGNSQPVSLRAYQASQARAAFQANPMVQKGLIAIRPYKMQDGTVRNVYAVKGDPNAYTSLQQAMRVAEKVGAKK